MAPYVHIYDPDTRQDRVMSIDDVMSFAEDRSLPEEYVHAMLDAARYEVMTEHEIVRGRFARLNWNIATDPLAGALAANTWRTVGIGPMNRFNPVGTMGWSYVHDAQSRWICPQSGWWDLDFWCRGGISVPAVPAYLLTSVHLAYRVTRAVTTPQLYLQLNALDNNVDTPMTSTPMIQEIGDTYAPFTVAGGPPVGTQTFLRSWGISGADSYPFYAGDILELVWRFQGGGPIQFLDFFEARTSFQRVEGFLRIDPECC